MIYIRLRRAGITLSSTNRRSFVGQAELQGIYTLSAMKTIAVPVIGRKISTGPVKRRTALPIKSLILFSIRRIAAEYSINKYILIYLSAFISVGLLVLGALLLLNLS